VAVDSSEEFTVEVRGVFDDMIDGPNTIHAGLRWTFADVDCRVRRQSLAVPSHGNTADRPGEATARCRMP
jgi:hypothetical protein